MVIVRNPCQRLRDARNISATLHELQCKPPWQISCQFTKHESYFNVIFHIQPRILHFVISIRFRQSHTGLEWNRLIQKVQNAILKIIEKLISYENLCCQMFVGAKKVHLRTKIFETYYEKSFILPYLHSSIFTVIWDS